MTDEERLQRAQNAENILNNDLFKDAIRVVRDQCVEAFKNTEPGDIEGLRTARVAFEVAEKFVNVLAGYMRDGQIAKIRIDAVQAAAKKQRAKRQPLTA